MPPEKKPKKQKKLPHTIKTENVPFGWKERLASSEMYLRNGKFYTNETELDKYFFQKKLTQEQFEAGSRYHADFFTGNIEVIAKMNLTCVKAKKSVTDDITINKLSSSEKYRLARSSLIKIHQEILDDICCYGKTLTEFERSFRGVRHGSSIQILRHALDYLEKHYSGKTKA